jgi:hypothetical protein
MYTAAGKAKAMHELAGYVEQFIIDGLQDWAAAARDAIDSASDPVEEESAIYWFLGLAGNMLWAATVFFPPAAAVGAITLEVKAASLLGAAIGSGSIQKLYSMPVNKPSGKQFLKAQIAENQDQLRDLYVRGGDAFVKDSLYFYLLGLLDSEPGEATDEKLFSGGVRLKTKLRNYTISRFLFPSSGIDPNNLYTSLSKAMTKQVEGALGEFNKQYEQYDTDAYLYWKLNCNNCTAGNRRTMMKEYKDEHPFNPRLTFSVAPWLQVWNPWTNPTGDVIEKWKKFSKKPNSSAQLQPTRKSPYSTGPAWQRA